MELGCQDTGLYYTVGLTSRDDLRTGGNERQKYNEMGKSCPLLWSDPGLCSAF